MSIIVIPSQTILMDPASATITYSGKAPSGTLTSTAGWQISRLTFDASKNLIEQKWAGGNGNFTNIWDNRAALVYT